MIKCFCFFVSVLFQIVLFAQQKTSVIDVTETLSCICKRYRAYIYQLAGAMLIILNGTWVLIPMPLFVYYILHFPFIFIPVQPWGRVPHQKTIEESMLLRYVQKIIK